MLSPILLSVILAVYGKEECGTLTPGSTQLPWAAGIYKNSKGSPPDLNWWGAATLVSNKAVITVAHKLYLYLNAIRPAPPSAYSVAVGAQPWPWAEPVDISTQYSQAASIHLAPGFKYSGTGAGVESYGDDIAVVIVSKPFVLTPFIKPVCLNFEYDFERKHLEEEGEGKASIWGDSDWSTDKSYFLRISNLHQVLLKDCLNDEFTDSLDAYSLKILSLTVSDKICFGLQENASAPCNADDNGAGISYPAEVDGVERYYLWAVYSTPLNNGDDCTTDTYYLFTPVLRYESFIKKLVYPENTDQQKKCEIPPPPYPEHGSYVTNITRTENAGGKEYALETLVVSCEPGYGVIGPASVSCFNGFWLQSFPKCVRMCALKPHPSVVYTCSDTRDVCGALVPPGTLVTPTCKAPHYRSPAPLHLMSCSEDGYWDYVARCVPDCGRVIPQGTGLVFGGAPVKKGELPWHIGIYRKTYRPYLQVCGGSLISTTFVISAAHCFWHDLEKQLPANEFAVAAGKLYRAWDDPGDDAQKCEVAKINLPPRFQGSGSNYQDDIAVVEVATPFEYRPHVRPVCLNFDPTFESLQLKDHSKGKVAGWGLTTADGSPSPVLQAAELPYVDVGTCIVESPPNFREYITSDKICAGTPANGRSHAALCKGDSGGGLAFPGLDHGVERFFLRGVVSTAPNNEHACNTASFTSFTTVTKHQNFLKQFLTDQ